MHNNNFLLSLSRLVQNRYCAIRSMNGITTISASVGQIKSAICAKFRETVCHFSRPVPGVVGFYKRLQ